MLIILRDLYLHPSSDQLMRLQKLTNLPRITQCCIFMDSTGPTGPHLDILKQDDEYKIVFESG